MLFLSSGFEKQPSRGVAGKRCSENMPQIYRRASMPKGDFNKVASNFIKITLRYGCSAVDLLHVFGTPFPTYTFGCCFWASFAVTDDLQDRRRRKTTMYYYSLLLSLDNKHSGICLEVCARYDYHIFLIKPLVTTRLLIDEIRHFTSLSIWQLRIQLFASPYILLAYIFEMSYSKLVTWWAKNQVSSNQNARNSWGQIERRTKWYWTNIWLFDDEMSISVGLLVDLILGFCYGNLSWGTCGLKLASTSILVLQVKSLTKFNRKMIVTLKNIC